MSTVQIQNDQFYQAVTYVFKSWTALKLAVEMQWGGVDSEDKRDWLVDVVVEYFGKHGKETYAEDVESILQQVMADEFYTLLEDDSAYQVSKDLIKLYAECMEGNYSSIDLLRSRHATSVNNNITSSKKVNQVEDDDDNDDKNENIEIIDAMDISEDVSSNNQNKMYSSKKEPIIDDEGFQLVTKRRK
ncbi:Pre-rRNA-processing protein TSR2-domain-containing protein [Gigaspora margarita]|uniref:Pre-rRNA-processing protein TSR2-domain-containing protein n=1 Tax=Gigaspora margarita TaxID=4874 RepID=A0A8H4ARD9_GIGMA|nr:Pre-rRNA-processing protein TSR2-domain-containing protein [Gigaspora margarita]